MLRYDKVFKRPVDPITALNLDAALITGGLAGLGLEMVKLLQDMAQIYILDIQPPLEKFSSSVRYIKCDLRCPESLETALDSVYSTLGKTKLSVVVNNAGIRGSGSLLGMEESSIRKVFEVNTFAMIRILKKVVGRHLGTELLQQLIEQQHLELQPSFLSIVNISSILGTFGPKNLLAYSASKAASIQIHECFSEELRKYPSIRPLLVMPGQLSTQMFDDVAPSRLFFAPIIDHRQLAKVIVGKIRRREIGVLCEPLYANFLPGVKVLPLFVQRFARWVSQMDEKIQE